MYSHSTPHRVRLSDTDHFEVMHFRNYFRLFEKGVIEMYRSAGMDWDWFRENDVMFLIASVSCDFRKPLRLDDIVDISVTASDAGNSSLSYDIEMFRTHRSGMHPGPVHMENAEESGKVGDVGDGRELVASGKLVHVFIGPDKQPDRLPDSIRSRFSV